MNISMNRYSLATRLAHVVMTASLVGLYLTALRLAWFGGPNPLFAPDSWLDKIAPSGQVYWWHKTCGLILIFSVLFCLVELLLNGQLARLTALFTDRRRDYRRKLFYLVLLAAMGVGVISGVSLYMGLYEGRAGLGFMHQLHHYAAVLLVILTVVHLIDVIFEKSTRVNAMFFGYRDARFFEFRPFVFALVAAAVIGGGLSWMIERPHQLVCRRLDRSITVDGKLERAVWDKADSLRLTTVYGANLDGGASQVTIKSFHDGRSMYFLLRWDDPDRSFNRQLVKTESKWEAIASEYLDLFGESIHYEDQVALTLGRTPGGCAAACHLRTELEMGLHYTCGDTADQWQWRAVSTNPIARADDGWWAGHQDDSIGGRRLDNLASGGYFSNLNQSWQEPYFLPTHPAADYWINPHEPFVQPYFAAEDSFAVGTQLPSVIVTPFEGDRGDVRAFGRWVDGGWTVELARAIKTGSSFDIELRDDLYIGVAVFDNAEKKHAFHLRPIRLVME